MLYRDSMAVGPEDLKVDVRDEKMTKRGKKERRQTEALTDFINLKRTLQKTPKSSSFIP
jgi:hypothetical protein